MGKKNTVAANAAINILRQCCGILFPLLITRHVTGALGAANYGKVGFGNSVMEYFTLIAALGVSAYGVREGAKVREDPAKLQAVCSRIFTINLLSTALSYGLLALVLIWKPLQSYRALLVIQSSVILFGTLGADWINNIFEDFRYIAIRQIFFQLLGVAGVLWLVHSPGDYLLYAGIMALSKIGGNVANIFYIRKRYLPLKLTRDPQLRSHLKGMLFLFGSSAASSLYLHFGTTLLPFFHGDAATGVYSLSMKIYTIVKQLLYAVACVVLPRLAAHLGREDEGAYQKLLNQLLAFLLALLLPACVGLYILSPQVIDLLAGSDYLPGVQTLRLLALALPLGIGGYFLLFGVLIPKNQEKASLLAPVAGAAANVLLSFLLIPKLSLFGAALGVLAAEGAALLVSLGYSRGLWQPELPAKQVLGPLFGSAAVAVICILAQQLQGTFAILAAAAGGSVIAYGLIILLFRK